MKKIVKKIVLGVSSVWAITAGTSLWASQPEEEPIAKKSYPPILKKAAQHFTSDDIAFANQVAQEASDKELYVFDEPAPVPPTYPPIITAEEEAWRNNLEVSRLAALFSADETMADEKEVKSPKTPRKAVKKTHSIKESKDGVRSESPKGGRKRTGSKVKKDEAEILKELLPSSSGVKTKSPLPTPLEIAVLEESENHGPLMEATMPSKIVSAPPTLSHGEVEKLMEVTLINKKLALGYGSTLSGDVAAEKKDIQGGKASHKLAELGVQRIKNLLKLYPNACGQLIIDEKAEYHTLRDEGYKGVVGHYKLILPTEDGKYETIEGSSFTIAFAVLK